MSSVLNLANAFLELLNTPFGQFATRVVLVTTALTGLWGVLDNYAKFMKGGAIAKGLAQIFDIVGPGATTVEKLIGGFRKLLSTLGPAAAIFAALAVAIKAGTAKFDAYNEAVENTAAAQSKLGEYKDELADLESRTDTLTEAERHRLEVLREITAEQEKQVQQAKQAEYEAYSEAEGSGAGVAVGTTGTGSGGIGGWGSVETIANDVYQLTEYQKQLNDLQEQYANQTAESAMSTGEYYTALQTLNDGYADTVAKLRDFIEAGIEVTDSERALVMAYDEAQIALGNVGQSVQIVTDAYNQLVNSGEISKATWETLIAYYPQLADGAVQTANGYQIQQSALENLMSAEQLQQVEAQNVVNAAIAEAQQAELTGQAMYDYASAIITASNTQLSVGQQMAALQALAQQAGYTAQAIAQVMGFSDTAATNQIRAAATGLMRSGQAKTSEEAMAMAKANYMKGLWGSLTTNYTPSTTTVNVPKASAPSYSGTGGGGTTTSTRTPSTGSATSSVDNSQREAAQAEIKKLQSQQDVIQDQIDAINEKYDQQLQELEDINDELEDQIRLQELLEDLAEAKSRTKMVFKDGRFQYVQDSDAVSKAQQNLDEYYREKELAAKKKQIEAERQLELEGLNAEKKRIEERIKYWRNFLSDMSGVYSTGLSNLSDYVNQWNSYVDSMKQPTTDTSGGGSSGGGSSDKDDTPSGGSSGGGSSINDETAAIKQTNARIANQYPRNKGYSSANNSQYDASTTKKIQAWYGTSADGIWGQNSYAAANNRNIDSAAGLYYAVKSKYSSFAAFKNMGGYAGGTLSASGGIHMLGEQGPELRVLNKGDGVIPAKQTARLWSFANDPAKFLQNIANYGGGNRSEVINVQNVTLPNVRNAQDFVAGLRNLAYQRAYAR